MLNRMSLREMAEAVRARSVSPLELVVAHFAEIHRTRAQFHAFVELFEEEALKIAKTSELRGPLAGVPVTVKDSFDIAGKRTACGSRLRLDHRAAGDSTAVTRLRGAGAIILGKTACPEFLMNYDTESHLTPATRNPRDPALTAGGSSGGEAAAIAAFCSAGGIGSDGGGSIRLPAAFCGIAGLKPTPGRVSAAGHWPEIAHPGGLLGVAGPMARTVSDLRLLYEVVAGHDPLDPFSVPDPPEPPVEFPPTVVVLDQFTMTIEVRTALEQTALRCAEAGWRVESAPAEFLGKAHELWQFLFIRVNAPRLRGFIDGRESECHWTGLELIGMVKDEPPPSAAGLCGVLLERDRLRSRVCQWLEERDAVLLAPVCGRTAWALGGRSFDLLEAIQPLTFANLLGLPALALPAGIQFAAAPWRERLLLQAGEALEQRQEQGRDYTVA